MKDDRRALLWVLAGATLFAPQDMLIKLFEARQGFQGFRKMVAKEGLEPPTRGL